MRLSKLIINAAPTGVVPTRDQTPFVPITPAEIARDTKQAYDLGASIVHVHARDKDAAPTHAKTIYREIILRIRELCDDIIITVSTSGRRTKDVHQRLEVLELDGDAKPDMASLTLGSMNFINDTSITHPEDLVFMLDQILLAGLKPEFEIFDTGMANYMTYLHSKKKLTGPQYANLILGSLGTMPATPKDLFHLVGSLPQGCMWAATGVGRFAFPVQCLSIAAGGHVRVGIEDSIYMNKTEEPASNQQLIERVRRVADAMDRQVMPPADLRKQLFQQGPFAPHR